MKSKLLQTSKNRRRRSNSKNSVNTQPGFFNYKEIGWDRAVTDGNFVLLTGTLVSTDDQKVPVGFELEQEDGKWKVLQIQVGSEEKPVNDEKAMASKKMEFSQFVLGSNVDEEGIVTDNTHHLPITKKRSTLNLLYRKWKIGFQGYHRAGTHGISHKNSCCRNKPEGRCTCNSQSRLLASSHRMANRRIKFWLHRRQERQKHTPLRSSKQGMG